MTATIGKPVTAAEMLAANADPGKDALTIIGEATTRMIAALMTEPVKILSAPPGGEAPVPPSETVPENKSVKKWLTLLTLGTVGVILLLAARSKRRRQ